MNEPPTDDRTGADNRDSAGHELLADLADDFAGRHRRGERPSVEEYARQHPAVAEQIRELFPAMLLMERQSELDPTLGLTPAAEQPGAAIGRYKLLERIGEGGFGVVYMAEQQHPIRRKVALKVIKAGMDTRQVIARFEAERQALAMMDHANIAKVLDAGATDAGRPYFVMELVPGVPITDYCEKNQLPPRERLALFVQVCRAVQHAHTKGVIHRDLKPTNVLVMVRDDKPVPKVIDFGVAKATGVHLTDRTLFTQLAQMVGTPLYMSPEQAQMGGTDVDTRSDVYSLGVMLYELLTGMTPFDRQRLGKAALDEVRRIIREEEPPKPSTRLSTAAAAVPSATPARGQELRRLSGLVRGELDWIVMKTLEKDRSRRYETANGFAQDIERYLSDEPVQACPPSATYRFRKFVRRNRAGLGVAGLILFFVVLLGGVVGWGVRYRAAREREIALETTNKLAQTEEGIRQALDRGTRSRAELHAILKKPGGVQQLLNQSARWELFIKTAQGELAQARRSAVRAEGSLDAESTRAMDQLEQQLTSDQADYDLARRLEKIRLDRVTSVEGENLDFRQAADEYPKAFVGLAVLNADPVTVAARLASSPIKDQLVAALDDWASVAFIYHNEGLADHLLALARQAAPDPAWGDRLRHLQVWRDQEALGKLVGEAPAAGLSPQLLALVGALLQRANNPLSESWLRLAQAEHPADFWLNFELAFQLLEKNPVESAGFYRVALAVRPGTSTVYYNLGIALYGQKKLPEAIAAFHKAIEINPKFAIAYSSLGGTLVAQQKLPEAFVAIRKAIELDPRIAGPHIDLGNALRVEQNLPEAIVEFRKAIEFNPKSTKAYVALGSALRAQHKLPDAVAAYQKAIEIDPKNGVAHCDLGPVFDDQGLPDAAIAEYREALRLNPDLLPPRTNLAGHLINKGLLDEAVAECREALRRNPNYALAYYTLGVTANKKGLWDEAITHFGKAAELDPKLVEAHAGLGNALYRSGRLDEAIAAYREAIRLKPDYALAHSNLGGVLREKGLLHEAIAALREAVRLEPHNAAAHYKLGLALRAGGDLDGAERAYREAVRLDGKHHGDAIDALAQLLLSRGNLKEAIATARNAVELAPQTAMAWQVLGRAHYRNGDWKASIEALEKSCAVQDNPKGGDSAQWFFLAMAHWRLGEKEKAREFYERAVQWMDKNQSNDEALLRFRAEADELLDVEKKKSRISNRQVRHRRWPGSSSPPQVLARLFWSRPSSD